MTNQQNRYTTLNEHVTEREPGSYLDDLPEWNRQIAKSLAHEEGLELSDEHWEVLHYLRRRFATQGQVAYARQLHKELDQEFGDGQGSRFLYRLFPGGPVTQGSRIAGLPLPNYSVDRSFGSVH